MKPTDPIYIDIANWFNGRRDYEAGVNLFLKYGKNKGLARTLPGRQHRYQRKLEYELSKIIGIHFDQVDKLPAKLPEKIDHGPRVANTFILPEPPPIKPAQDAMVLPAMIRRIIYEYHDLMEKRRRTHEDLKKVPSENNEGNNAQRAELIRLMEKFSERLDILFGAHKLWEETGKVPDEKDLYEPKQSSVPLPADQLAKRRLELQKSLSKDRNMLEFQSKIKKDQPCPMPAGPKRDKVEARIREKEKQIANIEKALHDINKAR